MGFKTGLVTNAYWATSEEDAELWLRPLHDVRLSDISISDDNFIGDKEQARQYALNRQQAGYPWIDFH